MTKEELEKEAEEKYVEVDREFIACQDEGEVFNIGYVLGAEPREKQIEIDAKQIRALQKQNGELTDELKDLRKSIKDYGAGCYENGLRNGKRKLEAQIEKMRNCANCKNYNGNEGFCVLGSGYGYYCNLEKWEVKEK